MSNNLPAETDVLIVGMGPVGATLACFLGRYGVRTLVIDREADIYTAPRAIALDNEALRVLQNVGLSDEAFERVHIPVVRMQSPYVGFFAQMNMAKTIDCHPALVTFFQPDLERALRDQLSAYEHVCAASCVELTGLTQDASGVRAQLRLPDGSAHAVASKFLIGADGANSAVRAAIGQEFVGQSYDEDWLIVDARNVPDNIDHVEFICNPRRPVPHMVAPGGRTRWEFMLRSDENASEMERDEVIRKLLAPWGDSEKFIIERKAVYRFQARSCARYSQGNVFVAGDAAHVTPPFAGQGLVSGLRDAANLSWKLAYALKGLGDHRILQSYDVERRPHAIKMIDLARGMGQLIMPRNALKAIALQGSFKILRLIPGIRQFLDDFRPKPKNAFEAGLFVRGKGKIRRGSMMPQLYLRDAGNRLHRSDTVLGDGFCLIALGKPPQLERTTAERWQALGGRVMSWHRIQTPMGRDQFLIEPEDGAALSVPEGWCVLVRPDRVVCHDGPLGDADRLVNDVLALMKAPVPVQQQEEGFAA